MSSWLTNQPTRLIPQDHLLTKLSGFPLYIILAFFGPQMKVMMIGFFFYVSFREAWSKTEPTVLDNTKLLKLRKSHNSITIKQWNWNAKNCTNIRWSISSILQIVCWPCMQKILKKGDNILSMVFNFSQFSFSAVSVGKSPQVFRHCISLYQSSYTWSSWEKACFWFFQRPKERDVDDAVLST